MANPDSLFFFSTLRFKEEDGRRIKDQAVAMKAALEEYENVFVYVCSVDNGDSIQEDIVQNYERADTFIIYGTETYGKKTTEIAISTYHEMNLIMNDRKHFFLLQMCDEFELTATRATFSASAVAYEECLSWTSGPPQANLVAKILKAAAASKKVPVPVKRSVSPLVVPLVDGSAAGRAARTSTPAPSATADRARTQIPYCALFVGLVAILLGIWHAAPLEQRDAMSCLLWGGKECYEKALEADPAYADAWSNLGIVGGGAVSGRGYSSKESYEKALEIDPAHAKAWFNLGIVGGGAVLGRGYSAKECQEKALETDPALKSRLE